MKGLNLTGKRKMKILPKSSKETLIKNILLKEWEVLDGFDDKRLHKIEKELYKEKSKLLSKIMTPFKFIVRILRYLMMEALVQIILIIIGLIFICPIINLRILRNNKIYEGIDKLVEFNLWDASRFRR